MIFKNTGAEIIMDTPWLKNLDYPLRVVHIEIDIKTDATDMMIPHRLSSDKYINNLAVWIDINASSVRMIP